MLPLEIREISYESEDYLLELALRTEILRKPLGLSFTPKELKKDVLCIHLGAFLNGEIVGCLLLHPLDGRSIQMRQVAVSEKSRGLGVGRQLVLWSEKTAISRGFQRIELHARQAAVSFYQALGYEIFGEAFIEITLPHRLMQKNLS